MKVLALTLLLVAVTAAQWQGGPPTRNDAPPSGGLMSGQIGGRSIQIKDRQEKTGSWRSCDACGWTDARFRQHMGFSKGCKAECDY